MSDKDKILKKLYENEDNYWMAPSYGMILDFFEAYWELHNMVLESYGEEPYHTPMIERRRYEAEKRATLEKTKEDHQ